MSLAPAPGNPVRLQLDGRHFLVAHGSAAEKGDSGVVWLLFRHPAESWEAELVQDLPRLWLVTAGERLPVEVGVAAGWVAGGSPAVAWLEPPSGAEGSTSPRELWLEVDGRRSSVSLPADWPTAGAVTQARQ